MPTVSPRLAFAVILVANCIVWSQSNYGQVHDPGRSLLRRGNVLKRGLDDLRGATGGEKECRPIAFPFDEQCSHVSRTCPASDTFLSISHLQSYFCSSTTARPFVFAGLLIWLMFLFSTLGISASDFFCPNLATLARLLGLDENVAGVTFLAFGNGSPDVFSTFSAMRQNSGSLAIGELLGAASFIVSVVIGSMCIIKPFRVNRAPFLRDAGFFMTAVTLFLVILWDGSIRAWEAGILVALYVVYAIVVVVGSWWERRMMRIRYRDELIRNEYAEDDMPPSPFLDDEPYRDEPIPIPSNPSSLTLPSYTRARASSHPGPPRLDVQTELPPRARSRTPSPSPRLNAMPSFSFVGALEFRQVVTSLQSQAATRSLSIFESPLTPYPGGHYHHHRNSWSRPHTPAGGDENVDPWDASLGVPLNDRSPQLIVTNPLPDDLSGPGQLTPLIEIGDDTAPIPIISRTPASPTSDADSSSVTPTPVPPTKRQRLLHVLGHAYHTLFPTLQDFRSKTVLRKVAAVFAAPAVFALTITLPVIVTPYNSTHAQHEKMPAVEGRDEQLVAFEEESAGVDRALLAEDEVEEEMHELQFNKWLMAAQCALGPLFCVAVLFKNTKREGWLLLGTAIVGLCAGVLVAVFAKRGDHPSSKMARCSMGFLVSMVWIMAIADEVVNVLQTFGFIFGLSDAIIGLTIFAVGNSLADLVANMSVAVFAPIMGFSACFGGPMLNMLLGVGISGSYIIHQTGQPYELHFSTTLLVSTIGLMTLLLATIIFVPLNGYFITRAWGFFLIICYVVIMTVNLIVEIVGAE